MKLSEDFIKHFRLFIYYYTNSTLQYRVRNILDINLNYREIIIYDADNVSLISTIYLNNIKLDLTGNVLNHEYAMKLAAQQIRKAIDYTYNINPVFESWELKLHN